MRWPSACGVVNFHLGLTNAAKDREDKVQPDASDVDEASSSLSCISCSPVPDECRDDDGASALSIITVSGSISLETSRGSYSDQISPGHENHTILDTERHQAEEHGDVQIMNDQVSRLASIIDDDQKVIQSLRADIERERRLRDKLSKERAGAEATYQETIDELSDEIVAAEEKYDEEARAVESLANDHKVSQKTIDEQNEVLRKLLCVVQDLKARRLAEEHRNFNVLKAKVADPQSPDDLEVELEETSQGTLWAKEEKIRTQLRRMEAKLADESLEKTKLEERIARLQMAEVAQQATEQEIQATLEEECQRNKALKAQIAALESSRSELTSRLMELQVKQAVVDDEARHVQATEDKQETPESESNEELKNQIAKLDERASMDQKKVKELQQLVEDLQANVRWEKRKRKSLKRRMKKLSREVSGVDEKHPFMPSIIESMTEEIDSFSVSDSMSVATDATEIVTNAAKSIEENSTIAAEIDLVSQEIANIEKQQAKIRTAKDASHKKIDKLSRGVVPAKDNGTRSPSPMTLTLSSSRAGRKKAQ